MTCLVMGFERPVRPCHAWQVSHRPLLLFTTAFLQEHRSTFYLPYWNIPFSDMCVPRLRDFKANLAILDQQLDELIKLAINTKQEDDIESLQVLFYSSLMLTVSDQTFALSTHIAFLSFHGLPPRCSYRPDGMTANHQKRICNHRDVPQQNYAQSHRHVTMPT